MSFTFVAFSIRTVSLLKSYFAYKKTSHHIQNTIYLDIV